MPRAAIKPGIILIFVAVFSLGALGQHSQLSKNVVALSQQIITNHEDKTVGINQIEEVDTLFRQSLNQSNGDFSESLIALTFACLPFRSFEVRIPFIKTKWIYSIYSADSLTFVRKNEFLVNNVYFDSPKNKFGDKDKLAHFYGAAFIGYLTRSVNIPDYIGCLVEIFEEVFKVDSYIDLRDVRTNKLGGLFGRQLRKNPNANPSMYFSFYNLTNMIR
jgi:hypothetical protein